MEDQWRVSCVALCRCECDLLDARCEVSDVDGVNGYSRQIVCGVLPLIERLEEDWVPDDSGCSGVHVTME